MTQDVRIEDYLDHVYAPLIGVVPYAKRQELRSELRAHLEALVASYEELGHSAEMASVEALRQFGDPRDLARRWVSEWTQVTCAARVQPAWRAMRIALGSFGLASLMTVGVLAIATSQGPHQNHSDMLVTTLVGFVLPLLAGLTSGLLAPARHAMGAFYALAVLTFASAALAIIEARWLPENGEFPTPGLLLALVQSIYWVPVGCGAAALGGSLRARLSLKPRRWMLQ